MRLRKLRGNQSATRRGWGRRIEENPPESRQQGVDRILSFKTILDVDMETPRVFRPSLCSIASMYIVVRNRILTLARLLNVIITVGHLRYGTATTRTLEILLWLTMSVVAMGFSCYYWLVARSLQYVAIILHFRGRSIWRCSLTFARLLAKLLS